LSYDLQVFAKRQSKAADLDAFLATQRGITAEGAFKRDGYVLLTAPDGVHAEVDGPNRLEAEDLPDAANGGIGRSGWLVQVSVKPSTDAPWPMDLAAHLARSADGVVYDPQEDRVTWPGGFQPRDPDSGEERSTEVELDWFTTRAPADPEIPRAFLQVTRSLIPEALPKRYGGFEPLPFRFEGPTADPEFIARWVEEAAAWPPMLFWTATRPSFGGSAFMSPEFDRDPPPPGRPISQVSMRLDGRALARDPDLTERVVELFTALAGELACVYAAGSVHRDLLVKRGRESSDYLTEAGPLPRANRWVGLPAAPTWLAWFGPAYARLLRPNLAQHVSAETDGALFLRLGTEPMDSDQLADVFPPLPLPLVARRIKAPAAWETGVRYTLASGPPSQLAEEIPDLDG
jgi:hypothetical protein